MSKHSFVYVHRMGSGNVRAVRPKSSTKSASDPLPPTKFPHLLPWTLVFLLSSLLVAGYWWHDNAVAHIKQGNLARLELADDTQRGLQAQITKLTTPPTVRALSAQEFVQAFDAKQLEHVSGGTKPPITGDEAADGHIRGIAEARGYRLRPLADQQAFASIDGYSLQEEAAVAWLKLRSAAAREGINLELTSTFRSYDEQKALFFSKFGSYTPAQISAGAADAAMEKLLAESSPPGYSKHHTGYTIDVRDGLKPGAIFKATPAYEWLAQDNFANAKKAGWVPSYPEGALSQGPEPEAWEYVWVGMAALAE